MITRIPAQCYRMNGISWFYELHLVLCLIWWFYCRQKINFLSKQIKMITCSIDASKYMNLCAYLRYYHYISFRCWRWNVDLCITQFSSFGFTLCSHSKIWTITKKSVVYNITCVSASVAILWTIYSAYFHSFCSPLVVLLVAFGAVTFISALTDDK